MLLRKGRTPNRSWLKGLQLNHNPQIATSREFRTIFANMVRKVLLWLRRVRLWHSYGCNLRGFDTFGGLESGVVDGWWSVALLSVENVPYGKRK